MQEEEGVTGNGFCHDLWCDLPPDHPGPHYGPPEYDPPADVSADHGNVLR